MRKIQTQGVHHITFIGADRQTSIDFWEGVLGMPFVFEQPNLDVPEENHLYFDPGDGRLITVFTNEGRRPDPRPNPQGIGNLHHIAFTVSRAAYLQVVKRLGERASPTAARWIAASWTRSTSATRWGNCTSWLRTSSSRPWAIRTPRCSSRRTRSAGERGDYNIAEEHLADAIEALTQRAARSLSEDRSPRDPYRAAQRS